MKTPQFPDVGVLAFVPDRWDIPWQPRHQVLSRLARYFRVVWVTPPKWWRDQLRIRGRGETSRTFRISCTPGLTIFRPPPWLPEVGRPAIISRWTATERLRRAQQILDGFACTKRIVYLWRPAFAGAVAAVPHDVSCYHIDDEYSFSATEQPLDPVESRLIAEVDQVFIHSPALLRKKGHLNPNTTFVPNGVDYEAFAARGEEPADLAGIPRPRIGYVGRIKPQLDLGLISSLARRHPHWSFVLVGPVEKLGPKDTIMRELSVLPNVHLLGPKPVRQLPAYTQHLDVGMLCYEVNDYTKYIYPLKLHEYLAAGIPVVGAPIESLHQFTDVVRLADGVDEWSRALTKALHRTESCLATVENRRSVARAHDWNCLVGVIARALCHRLGAAHLRRYEQICLDHGPGQHPVSEGLAMYLHERDVRTT